MYEPGEYLLRWMLDAACPSPGPTTLCPSSRLTVALIKILFPNPSHSWLFCFAFVCCRGILSLLSKTILKTDTPRFPTMSLSNKLPITDVDLKDKRVLIRVRLELLHSLRPIANCGLVIG